MSGALAAIVNAIVDGLSPLGLVRLDIPATPQKICRATQRSRGVTAPIRHRIPRSICACVGESKPSIAFGLRRASATVLSGVGSGERRHKRGSRPSAAFDPRCHLDAFAIHPHRHDFAPRCG